jgi:sugar diacid utilization regulator
MPAAQKRTEAPQSAFLDAFEEVSEAVESGAGLPAVARATAHALDASVVVLDGASSVLAVACQSSEDERAVLALEQGSDSLELRVADEPVGELRYRTRGAVPPSALLRMVGTLIGLELHRAQAPERESEAAVGDFLADLFSRKLTDRANIFARAEELGCDLSGGASVLVVRARPHHAEEGDWRARVLTVAERGARGVERTALAATIDLGPPRPRPQAPGGEHRSARPARELVIVIPGHGVDPGKRAADAVQSELESALQGFGIVIALSRPATDATDLHRSGAEALMAANVAEARGAEQLAFDETGAYRLLLPAMSENPNELQRFFEETVAPLVDYDHQYETELVRTLESFLEADGNVAKTAEKLFTHRHTIRYRLDRVKELAGLDVGSTDGRERLSLGLKSMRVLGIVPPGGPASEAGASAGRVPEKELDR